LLMTRQRHTVDAQLLSLRYFRSVTMTTVARPPEPGLLLCFRATSKARSANTAITETSTLMRLEHAYSHSVLLSLSLSLSGSAVTHTHTHGVANFTRSENRRRSKAESGEQKEERVCNAVRGAQVQMLILYSVSLLKSRHKAGLLQ